MKNIFLLSLLISTVLFSLTSCETEDPDMQTEFDYHAHIHSPTTDDKHVNDSIHMHITFESHTGEPVHHVNIRIYNKVTGDEVYNKPDAAHVHETSGKFDYHDDFKLSNENGVSAHTDWILEAKVWGDDGTAQEELQMIEFHVHPE